MSKTVTMMELRHNIGGIIDEMAYQHKDILIKRRNKIIGVIKPHIEVESDDEEIRNKRLDRLYGALKKSKITAEDWIHASDNIEQEYDARMKRLWSDKK